RHSGFDAYPVWSTELEILARLHQSDDFRRVNRRIGNELQDNRLRPCIDTSNAEGFRRDAKAMGFEQALDGLGGQTEAIYQLLVHPFQRLQGLAVGQPFVEYEPFVDVGAVAFRQQRGRM